MHTNIQHTLTSSIGTSVSISSGVASNMGIDDMLILQMSQHILTQNVKRLIKLTADTKSGTLKAHKSP